MNILLNYKKSSLELIGERGSSQEERYLEENPIRHAELIQLDRENKEAIASVIRDFEKHNISHTEIWRGGKSLYQLSKDHDMVVSVGGDGTFLDAARYITDGTPILGVNSNPNKSKGHFCAANASTFYEVLEQNQTGQLPRFQISKNGILHPSSILNDVIITKGMESMQYLEVRIDELESKMFNNSGLLISSGPGSTAFMHNIYGEKMDNSNGRLQYKEVLVREPKTGFADKINIYSHAHAAKAHLDGDYHHIKFGLGDTLQVNTGGMPLTVVTNYARK